MKEEPGDGNGSSLGIAGVSDPGVWSPRVVGKCRDGHFGSVTDVGCELVDDAEQAKSGCRVVLVLGCRMGTALGRGWERNVSVTCLVRSL